MLSSKHIYNYSLPVCVDDTDRYDQPPRRLLRPEDIISVCVWWFCLFVMSTSERAPTRRTPYSTRKDFCCLFMPELKHVGYVVFVVKLWSKWAWASMVLLHEAPDCFIVNRKNLRFRFSISCSDETINHVLKAFYNLKFMKITAHWMYGCDENICTFHMKLRLLHEHEIDHWY